MKSEIIIHFPFENESLLSKIWMQFYNCLFNLLNISENIINDWLKITLQIVFVGLHEPAIWQSALKMVTGLWYMYHCDTGIFLFLDNFLIFHQAFGMNFPFNRCGLILYSKKQGSFIQHVCTSCIKTFIWCCPVSFETRTHSTHISSQYIKVCTCVPQRYPVAPGKRVKPEETSEPLLSKVWAPIKLGVHCISRDLVMHPTKWINCWVLNYETHKWLF